MTTAHSALISRRDRFRCAFAAATLLFGTPVAFAQSNPPLLPVTSSGKPSAFTI
jgi:hypothetical protein